MKIFDQKELKEAFSFADEGGQSLHLMNHSGGAYPGAPQCFKRTRTFAHLIDADLERLIATAKKMGVRRIKVSREGVQRSAY